eukprot:gene4495-2313_t
MSQIIIGIYKQKANLLQQFDKRYKATTRPHYNVKNIKISMTGKISTMRTWDIDCLQIDQHRGLLAKTDVFFMAYSVMDRQSFKDVEQIWNKKLQHYFRSEATTVLLRRPHCRYILLGLKCDCARDDWAVSRTEAIQYALQNKFYYVESSAKDQTNVGEIVFDKLFDQTLWLRNEAKQRQSGAIFMYVYDKLVKDKARAINVTPLDTWQIISEYCEDHGFLLYEIYSKWLKR